MITNFKIFENINHGKFYKILTKIKNDSDKFDEIENYIGFDFEYKIKDSYSWDFEIYLNEENLSNVVDVEESVISYVQQMASDYSNYEYYLDADELNYVANFLSKDSLKEIKNLAKYVGFKGDVEEDGVIIELLEYLGLNDLIDDIMNEMRMEHERAVQDTADYVLGSFPFSFGFGDRNFNLSLEFDIDETLKHIEKYKLKVDNLKEYLEKINFSEISYEVEHDHYENLGDFEDLNVEVYNKVQNYVLFPETLVKEFVLNDDLELLKEHIEDAHFIEKYDYWYNHKKLSENLFEIANTKNGKILKFFKSYKFQKWFLKDNNIDNNIIRYKQLVENEILHPKIKNEYGYLVGGEKYNL